MNDLNCSAIEVPSVIDNVINTFTDGLRALFSKEGVSECVLQKLQSSWKTKLTNRNVLPIVRCPLPSRTVSIKKRNIKVKKEPSDVLSPSTMSVMQTYPVIIGRNMPSLTDDEIEEVLEIPCALNNNEILTNDAHNNVLVGNKSRNTTILKRACPFRACKLRAALQHITTRTKRKRLPRFADEFILRPNTEPGSQDEKFTISQFDGPPHCPKISIKSKIRGELVNRKLSKTDRPVIDSNDDDTDDENALHSFECENVIVCKYENVKRVKDKWRINLKHGIMHLKEKDYVFQSASTVVRW